MNWVIAFVSSPLAEMIGVTLFHFLWQGIAIALGAALALHGLRRLAPESRYAAGLGALVLFAVAPLLTFTLMQSDFLNAPMASPLVAESAITSSAEPATSDPSHSASPPVRDAASGSGLSWVGWAAFLWLTGVVAMSLRLLGGWVCTLRLRRALALPVEEHLRERIEKWRVRLGVTRPILAATSSLIDVPLVLGWLRPALLLPEEGIRVLRLDQLEPLIVHELAHVCRNDYLVNLFQSLLETLFFFHPGVWWVSARVRLERECCCDAMTIRHFGDRDAYAEALIALESMRQAPVNELALAALRPGMLLQRIRRMYDAPPAETARQPWAPVLALTCLVLCALAGGVVAQAPQGGSVVAETLVSDHESPAIAESPPTAPMVEASTPPSIITEQPVVDDQAVAGEQVSPAALLLPLDIVGAASALAEPAQQLDVLIATRLSGIEGVRLVDRAQLNAAMQELQLSQSGLTSPETAQQLGRVTGAASIVTGKLMQLDGQRMLTARLINTETSEFRQFEMSTDVDAPLAELATTVAEKLAPMLTEIVPAQPTVVGGDPAIIALRATLAGRTLPRVTVSIPEFHLGTFVPDPAGEIEMIRTLRSLGFDVVDITTLAPRLEGSSWMDLFFDRSPDDGDFAVALREGMASAATMEHNDRIQRLKAHTDIFLYGEAFSEFAGEVHGFKSCQARLEARCVDVSNGRVAAADSRHANGADLGEFVAGKRALREAGRQTALALAPLLAEYWSTQIAAKPQ